MNWLLESPWPILIAGATVEVALIVALVRTGRAALLAAIAGTAVLTGMLLIVERIVVTETERVEATLDEISTTLEKTTCRPCSISSRRRQPKSGRWPSAACQK